MNDAVRRAIRTFVQTFLGLYFTRLLGFLGQLSEWAGCNERGDATVACTFPDVSTLGYGLVVAGSAAVVAIVTLIFNTLEDKGVIPAVLKGRASSGVNPVLSGPTGTDRGAVDTGALLWFVLGCVVGAVACILFG